MKTLTKILDLLTLPERVRAGLLLGMILIMALLDMIGVASIMPFMAVLANPQLLETNAFLSTAIHAFSALGITTSEQFLFLLGSLVFVLLVVSQAFKALTAYAQTRFTLMREYTIGKRLVEGYLYQPYSWFISRHSADMGKMILSEVKEVIDKVIVHTMNLIAQSAVVIALLTLLVLIDPILALSVGAILILAYVGIHKLMSSFLSRIGSERVQANKERFTAVSEAFGAAKEVKVGGLEQAYINRFAIPAQTYAKHQASAQVVSQMPRFALEAVAFGGLILLVLMLMTRSGSFANALPIVALYAFAAYRLMPALHQIYSALTQLRFAGPALDALHQDLMSLPPPPERTDHQPTAMGLQHAIRLNKIQFSYPNTAQPALKNISLRIPAHSTVGLVGATGSGKTTTVDLILGLLEAQQGTLEIDGQVINQANRRQWQRAIGYVPQQIYLADDTVAANIAFGVATKDINTRAVERAAKNASLHEFVMSDLPQQYQTKIGERGVRLSGGQRQRIGIARALYHNPKVLIFDEATSALDNLTEESVMEAVRNLGNQITIIMIAHRLSTVKECDTIFLLDNGVLKGVGDFEKLTQTNSLFLAMNSKR
ncbi:ABC transporter ATP-binding protein [Hydrogenophaga taeniospiralis]|uniref:ABC transporter ATP-binding protein n=1 Tax=Hydrogenophaga taeniospiralis TaxID=65656 RepID=UPI001CFBEFDE|nr:ABC transporter ATP-binding protein [Hydrogenophaga taeniospiralis]UCU92217.1 ABC transporter ATP-binding protein [Hydrogenophaga taeniospiralis]